MAAALPLPVGASEGDANALAVSDSEREAPAEAEGSPDCAGEGEPEFVSAGDGEGVEGAVAPALLLPAGVSEGDGRTLAVSNSEGEAPAVPDCNPECAGDGEPELVSAGEVEGAGGEVASALALPAGDSE